MSLDEAVDAVVDTSELEYVPPCDAHRPDGHHCPSPAVWVFSCVTPGCETGGNLCEPHRASNINDFNVCRRCGLRGRLWEFTVWAPLGGVS